MSFEGPFRRIISSFLTQAEVEAAAKKATKSKIRKALEKYRERLPMFKDDLKEKLLEETGCEKVEESTGDYNTLEHDGVEVYRYQRHVYRFYCPDGVYEALFRDYYVEVKVGGEYIVANYDKRPEL
jgi:hypothetical protein